MQHPQSTDATMPTALTAPPIAADQFISMADIARQLGVSYYTIKRWKHNGYLPRASRFGRFIRWRRSVIEAWLESQGPQPANVSAGE